MGLDNISNLSEDIQLDCATIKKILLDMCEGKIPFQKENYQITLEYLNRELIIKEGNVVINTLPFEVIYFDLKKSHLSSDKYKEAVINIIHEEIDKSTLQKYA